MPTYEHMWAVTSYKVTVTCSYFCNCNSRLLKNVTEMAGEMAGEI